VADRGAVPDLFIQTKGLPGQAGSKEWSGGPGAEAGEHEELFPFVNFVRFVIFVLKSNQRVQSEAIVFDTDTETDPDIDFDDRVR
jgi:hypothetical protein